MKLVDILARELKVWPGQYYQIFQDSGGNLIGSLTNGDLEDCDSEDLPFEPVSIAWDGSSAIIERAQWQAAVDALKAEKVVEWHGEGLPPVGVVCEFNDGCGGGYKKVEVMYVSAMTVLVKFDGSPGEDVEGAYSPHESLYFRPIRTPEQIAAEERDSAVNKMLASVSFSGKSNRELFAQLYEAGYRKFEIVEGEE